MADRCQFPTDGEIEGGASDLLLGGCPVEVSHDLETRNVGERADRHNVVWVDGANCRYLLRTRPRAFTQTVSLEAILLVSWPPVNCHRQRGLLDSAGAPTVDWLRRHMHADPVMSGGRQSHGSDGTAVALDTDPARQSGRLPAKKLKRRDACRSIDAGHESATQAAQPTLTAVDSRVILICNTEVRSVVDRPAQSESRARAERPGEAPAPVAFRHRPRSPGPLRSDSRGGQFQHRAPVRTRGWMSSV